MAPSGTESKDHKIAVQRSDACHAEAAHHNEAAPGEFIALPGMSGSGIWEGFAGILFPQLRYTCLSMASENLIDAVNSLSPEEQTSVLQFIEYLKGQNTSRPSSFLQAEHPELLHRLSQ